LTNNLKKYGKNRGLGTFNLYIRSSSCDLTKRRWG